MSHVQDLFLPLILVSLLWSSLSWDREGKGTEQFGSSPEIGPHPVSSSPAPRSLDSDMSRRTGSN